MKNGVRFIPSSLQTFNRNCGIKNRALLIAIIDSIGIRETKFANTLKKITTLAMLRNCAIAHPPFRATATSWLIAKIVLRDNFLTLCPSIDRHGLGQHRDGLKSSVIRQSSFYSQFETERDMYKRCRTTPNSQQ